MLFQINSKKPLPDKLKDYKPVNANILKITYDKNKTKLKEIIDILNKNKICFLKLIHMKVI